MLPGLCCLLRGLRGKALHLKLCIFAVLLRRARPHKIFMSSGSPERADSANLKATIIVRLDDTVTVSLRSKQPLRQDTGCPGCAAAGPPGGSGNHTLLCPGQGSEWRPGPGVICERCRGRQLANFKSQIIRSRSDSGAQSARVKGETTFSSCEWYFQLTSPKITVTVAWQ